MVLARDEDSARASSRRTSRARKKIAQLRTYRALSDGTRREPGDVAPRKRFSAAAATGVARPTSAGRTSSSDEPVRRAAGRHRAKDVKTGGFGGSPGHLRINAIGTRGEKNRHRGRTTALGQGERSINGAARGREVGTLVSIRLFPAGSLRRDSKKAAPGRVAAGFDLDARRQDSPALGQMLLSERTVKPTERGRAGETARPALCRIIC